MEWQADKEVVSSLVDRIVTSYQSNARTEHMDASFLPNRDHTIQILELMRRLLFPAQTLLKRVHRQVRQQLPDQNSSPAGASIYSHALA